MDAPRKLTRKELKLPSQKRAELRLKGRGIKLLDPYTHNRAKHRFQCREGHVWKTTALNVFAGTGCPACAVNRHRLTDAEIQKRLRPRGIKLLGRFVDTHTEHRFQCKKGHVWKATASTVFSSGRKNCPECHPLGYGFGEESVRKLFEKMTRRKFPRQHPRWLKGRGRHPLQLDGYNENLGVAFEYQGPQHYFPVAKLGGEKAFRTIQKNDERKRSLCRTHGVVLIRISYRKSHDAVERLVRRRLRVAGVKLR